MTVDKKWEELTGPEKIEDLRKDITRIYRILTELRDEAAVMKQWGPLLNQILQRVNNIDGGGT